MNSALPQLAAMMELNQFSERLAKASALLSQINSDDVELARSPREKIAQIGERALYRIALEGPRRVATPVLIVYAMVGRWTILDLQEDRSFVRNLVEAGCQVYVLDWGHPTPADRYDDFGDLVNLYMDSFVDEIRRREGIDKVNILGICQGGVLSLLYAALHPTKVRNLVTLVTPVDFHADQNDKRLDQGFMNVWARGLSHEDVDSLINTLGNIPGEVGGAMFSMMTPVRSLAKYNLTLLEVGQDHEKLLNFLRMEKWLADRPAHPGEAARQWLKDLYQDNKLVKGELVVGGRRVDLKNLTMPVLNIFSDSDHIIPSASSRALREAVGTNDYSESPAKGGHIGILVARSQEKLREQIAGWLAAR
jgi:poly[(R)-3-hydroxyalkanoate] polymerase subunit PhaC